MLLKCLFFKYVMYGIIIMYSFLFDASKNRCQKYKMIHSSNKTLVKLNIEKFYLQEIINGPTAEIQGHFVYNGNNLR